MIHLLQKIVLTIYLLAVRCFTLLHRWFSLKKERKKSRGEIPIPPDVPMRKMVTLEHLAWYSSLISSCNMIAIEGMPIPCWNESRNSYSTCTQITQNIYGRRSGTVSPSWLFFLRCLLTHSDKTSMPWAYWTATAGKQKDSHWLW